MIDAPGPGTRGSGPAWWSPRSASGATIVYAALALVVTWPLATALTRSIPWDMGDPVLNAWILAWSADHLWRFVTGDLQAFGGYWDANIFYPAPLALAYSEHLFAQAVQVLPVWALTRNPILCYNLTLLATYVLSGLGAFLLARDLTGDPRAAFVAGILFGFAPYRIAQLSHVQVLSAQWMPFALYAFRRHLATGRWLPFGGFVAAMLLQHLSCGYYMVYFAPLGVAWIVVEVATRGGWRDARLLARLAGAAVLVGAGTWPFVTPYLELRALGFPPRPLDEVIRFSANTWSYLTAVPAQWLWGSVAAAWPRPEGELFPGVVAPALASIGVLAAGRSAWMTHAGVAGTRGWQRLVDVAARAVLIVSVSVVIAVFAIGPLVWRVAGRSVRASDVTAAVVCAIAAAAVWLATSRPARLAARTLAATPLPWLAAFTAVAFVLSLGPVAAAGPATVMRDAPYAWLYAHVPGYDGLRVPARHAMLATFGFSMLGAYGVRALGGATRRPAVVAACLAVAAVLEGCAMPLPLDRGETANGLALPPVHLPNAAEPSPVYAYVRRLPADAVIAEFPFGTGPWELRYMYASTLHWRRLVNGYSGGVPQSYSANVGALRDVFRDPAAAWSRLQRSGTTHVIVHENVFPAGQGAAVTAWLRARGARPLARFGDDQVLRLP